jgi:hypothetical protein
MQKVTTFVILMLVTLIPINTPAFERNASDPVRAYPRPIPEDTCFETVVGIQPFQAIKYTVPVIGWKNHTELVYITPSGAVVINPAGLYLVPIISSGKSISILLDPDKVSQKLINGHMPGVESTWSIDGLQLRQTIFCSPLNTNEVEDKPETLITLCRFTVKNQSKAEKKFKLQLQFGQVVPGHNFRLTPPPYNGQLSLESPFVMDGSKIKACMLTKGITAEIIGSALLFDLSLTPGQVKAIDLVLPCTPVEQTKMLKSIKFDERLALFRRFWRYELTRNEHFVVSEDRVQDAYRTCLAYAMILPKIASQSNDISPIVLRGETDKFVWTFYSTLAYGLSRDSFVASDASINDTWDSTNKPSALPYSSFLSMLRDALVIEDGDFLHLLPGSPRGWLSDGKTIEIKRAQTSFGDVNLTAKSSVKSGDIQIVVDPPIEKPADIILHIRPPVKYGYIESVTVNGKPWKDFDHKGVHLGKLLGRADVVCKF